MRKMVLAVIALAALLGATAHAGTIAITGFSTDPYAAQLGYDSFNYSVRNRFFMSRIGDASAGYGYSSGSAYGMAPTVADSAGDRSYRTYSRRQMDCVYTSGFTVWADFYQTWASQGSRDTDVGYKYRATAPALGFEYQTGNFLIGLATTYNWGKLSARDWVDHDQKVRTWDIAAYFQYNAPRWYANGTLGYGYNRYSSERNFSVNEGTILAPVWVAYGKSDKYHSNSFNIDGEFGYKLYFGNFRVTPNIGLRYFHDRRDPISEEDGSITNYYAINAGRDNYQVLELPVGVNLGYEIPVGNTIIVPNARFAWKPELMRRRGSMDGTFVDSDDNIWDINENAPQRNRHGFILGAGIAAKISNSLSAHIDYVCNIRGSAYEHHLNLGAGFTF